MHYIDFLPGQPQSLGPTLASTARAAEDIGAAMFALADHMFQMEAVGRVDDPFLEAYTAMGFVAGRTRTIPLASLVSPVTFRYPGVLAKSIATLDVLAGGRAVLGLGTGWNRREHDALGIPFPAASVRLDMLEETVHVCRQMWSDDIGPYTGKHFHLRETVCEPRPLRPPPILIGGSGERRTLRIVAELADAWNTTETLERLPHKLDALRRHCDAVERDFAEIVLTASNFMDPFADIDGYLRATEHYAQLGFDVVTVGPLPGHPDPVGFVERLGDEVVAHFNR